MNVYVSDSPHHGRGVFAARALRAGEAIITFSGPMLARAELDPNDYHLQIGEDRYLGPSRLADDYINHSCEPNGAFLQGLTLFAVRDLAIGEEITWDYSTAIDEADFTGFPCGCGAASCRGMVRSFRHLPKEQQERLRPWLLPYLREKYAAP